MASRIVQYFADKLKTLKEYPITLTKAVYDENGNRLDNKLSEIDDNINGLNSSLSLISYMPDYDNKVELASGATYTTPKNGILVLQGQQGGYSQCSVGGILFTSCESNTAAASSNTVTVPVSKDTDLVPSFAKGNAYFVPYK